MNKIFFILLPVLLAVTTLTDAQKKKDPAQEIRSSDLESHVTFLASPVLRGRMNGEPELDIAAAYLASQAKLAGLKPANGESYYQPYTVVKKSIDTVKTRFNVITGHDTVPVKTPLYQLVPTGPSDFSAEGDVAFLGYGIRSSKYGYDDLNGIKLEGKVLLIMDRAPMDSTGTKSLFGDQTWMGPMSFQMKLTTLIYSKAKAILIVPDPKSGFRSFMEAQPGLAGYLKTSISLKDGKPDITNLMMANMPKIIFINRNAADELLRGSGHTLDELQAQIDDSMKPASFDIPSKRLELKEVSIREEKVLNNVAGIIEGSDPVLKNEVVVFSGHYDHLGAEGQRINYGADDNASGCAALLEIADAFGKLNKKPARSALFLWVSGEEIGLFGSKSYVSNPLFPLTSTVADLNIDMIGRTREAADSTSETPMTSRDSVFVISDSQSSQLMSIAAAIDKSTKLDFDYSLSGRNHPLQLFSRSDHYNFVQNNIPVLFFTTGLHHDYHTPRDAVSKIDFGKMETVARTIFRIGLEVASRPEKIVVDNPYSSWGKSK